MIIISLLIGGLVCSTITYFILKPKLKQTEDFNTSLKIEKLRLQEEISQIKKEISSSEQKLAYINGQFQQTQELLESEKEKAQKDAEDFRVQSFAVAEEKLDRSLSELAVKIQQDKDSYAQEYFNMLADYAKEFSQHAKMTQLEIDQKASELEELRRRVDAAVEQDRRKLEEEEEKDFFRIVVPDSDLEEIKKLRSIIPDLRNPEALNKVIWKVYYEKPFNEMIGRVIGAKSITGIYKITNIQNGLCYVGQATRVADRWRQHTKRGIGAEAPTRNRLYPAMAAIGVENFTFELLEECKQEELNALEDFWQDFYHAKDFGYSIK